jgi:hypothetical protein
MGKMDEQRTNISNLSNICSDCADFLNHPCVECEDCPVRRLADRYRKQVKNE